MLGSQALSSMAGCMPYMPHAALVLTCSHGLAVWHIVVLYFPESVRIQRSAALDDTAQIQCVSSATFFGQRCVFLMACWCQPARDANSDDYMTILIWQLSIQVVCMQMLTQHWL